MNTFYIVIGITLVVAWFIHLLYCLGDERRRFRIVETKNNEFRVEKKGLFIPIWQRGRAKMFGDDKRIYTDWYFSFTLDSGKYLEFSKLEYAKEAVDAHFKLKEYNRKDKEVVNVWKLEE